MEGMRFGYGRVSTRDQNLTAQHDALLAAGVDEKNLYVEKISTRQQDRPELAAVRKVMRKGDTLVITKVDRLARSLLDLITIADELKAEGITLEILTGTFNRDDPMGEAFFQMTGVFAQLERDLIRQRTNEGLAASRARGRVGGRKPTLTPEQVTHAKSMAAERDETGVEKYTIVQIAKVFNVSENTMRYALNPDKAEAARKARRDRYLSGKQGKEGEKYGQ
jgi:DNA invertase Pin-like site-specific DNA recombinase